MALFGRKKKQTQKNARTDGRAQAVPTSSPSRNLSDVLVTPRVTEKSAGHNNVGVYTFLVRRSATKYDVRDAVRALFKVTPRKVTIVNSAPRTTHSRAKGRNIRVSGLKKANVFLQKGDRIDLA